MNITDNSPMHTVLSVGVLGLMSLSAFAAIMVVKQNKGDEHEKIRIGIKFRIKCWAEDQAKKRVKCINHYSRSSGPVHAWFSLSYASYYTVPRIALQGMPVWWQHAFLFLVNLLPETPEYVCQRRDENGKFIKDPWANYRRGNVEQLMGEGKKPEWKIIAVDNVKHPNK